MRELYDVAIVGYGPAGVVLANLLGRAGFRVAALDREAAIYPLPRAIHFDGEVMRALCDLGLKRELEAVTRPGVKGMHFVNAAGDVLLVRGGTALEGPHGCANNHYYHQPDLEAVLREGAKRYPNVEVFLRHEVFAIAEDAEGVTLSVENMANGTLGPMRARYVVGCDGARSLVRRLMGSTMVDLGLHQPWLVFDAILKRPVDLPDYTVQHCDPARPATSCNVIGKRRRWEIMLMPGDDPLAIARPESVWKLVSRWITPEDADLERAVVYTFHSVIAKGWRRGRLMIAGDAAHQTPPFLGQGLCAGVRDVVNLAWKLERVLHGQSTDALLDTYETEREPHVRAFIELAVRLGDIIQTTDPAVAAERDARFRAGSPEIFEFPAPGLGPGVRDAAGAPTGQPFPQPRLADGRRFDDAVGQRFALMAERGLITAADAATRARWQQVDAAVLDDSEPEVRDWLERHGVAAVLLRPDRYILGLARDAAELAKLCALLPIAD
jgi:3-(3-hydroxy-phenyl)propionate hydroxylase